MTARTSIANALFFTALITLGACSSDLTGTNKKSVQLSFTTNASSVAATGMRMSPDITVGANNELVLSKVQVVIDKIELNEGDNTSCVTEIEDSVRGVPPLKRPKTIAPVGVPTKTFPLATMGVMNLLSENWSRVPAWLLLYSSLARFVAS